MRALVVVMTLSCGALGCKQSRLTEESQDAQAVGIILPQRVAEGKDSLSSSFDIDAKSGRPKATLVLRLDYFPEPQPGQTTLPACFRRFPQGFVLGEVRCREGGSATPTPLLSQNVDQDCYTNPQVGRVKAAEPLLLSGCLSADVYAFSFDPPVRIDSEMR